MDLLDRKIIYELDIDARQSASEIAKKLSVAKETVNFRIKRLLQNKIIKGFSSLLDLSKIHCFFFKMFVKFKEIQPKRRKEILDFLAAYPQMSQVLLLEGKYDVQLFFLAKENSDMMKFMEAMNTFCGKEIHEKQILIVDTLYRFNLKVLYHDKHDIKEPISAKKSDYVFDDVSWNVLRQVANNARISVLDIAKNCNISAQLAQYHLKKLIKDKVIVSTHVSINYDALQMLHYHVTFQLNDHAVLPWIIEFFNSKNKSIFATTMIGCYDCSAELIVSDNQELREIIDNLLENFADKINVLDVFMIYKEYEMRLYPLENPMLF